MKICYSAWNKLESRKLRQVWHKLILQKQLAKSERFLWIAKQDCFLPS